jgi:hypothetical protein
MTTTTLLPLLDDVRGVLQSTLHTYVGNRTGRDELVRILRRMDDEALEQREGLNRARASVVAQIARWEDEALAAGPAGPNF